MKRNDNLKELVAESWNEVKESMPYEVTKLFLRTFSAIFTVPSVIRRSKEIYLKNTEESIDATEYGIDGFGDALGTIFGSIGLAAYVRGVFSPYQELDPKWLAIPIATNLASFAYEKIRGAKRKLESK